MTDDSATLAARSRADNAPLQQLKRACAELRALLQTMHEQRTHAREQQQPLDKPQFKAQRWQALVLLRALKAGLRDTFVAADAWKTRVQEKKDVVEAHQLKLQNLLYEKDHLLREILRCRGFSTKEMDKIEFDGASLPFAVDAARHREHLDQLTIELATRKRMIKQLEQLKTEMAALDAATAAKQLFLDSLRSHVAAIETASEGLQRSMAVPVTATRNRNRDAQALANPLYLLYCELDAYADASGSQQTMQLAVVDARPLVGSPASDGRHTKRSFPAALTVVNSSDSNKRLRASASRSPSAAPTIEPRTAPSRSPSVVRTASDGLSTLETGEVVALRTADKLLALRPFATDTDCDGTNTLDVWTPSARALELTLTLAVDSEAPVVTITLVFQYLPVVNVVTVELVSVEPASTITPLDATVLMHLFPNDDGLALPQLSPNYAFSGKSDGQELVFPHDAAARPYVWAQWLCGLFPLQRSGSIDSSPHRIEPSVRSVMQQLVKRLVTRVQLTRQLALLQSASGPSLTVHPSAQFLAATPQTVVESWSEIAVPPHDVFALFRDNARVAAKPMSDGRDFAPTGCRYFRVTFRHQRVRIAALVEVAPEYPVRAPRFLFQPKTIGGSRAETSSSSSSSTGAVYENQLKEIEIEVNAFYNELVTRDTDAFVLVHQVRKVQICCDMLHSALADTSAATFTLGVGRARRGKDRRQAMVVDPVTHELRHR